MTDIVLSCMELLHLQHRPVLSGVIGGVSLYLLFSILLLGAMIYKIYKHLILPWMILDMIVIIILFLMFGVWSFLSFSVGLLAAILFPFLGGLILGLKIIMWRQVRSLYRVLPNTVVSLRQYQMIYVDTGDDDRARRKMSNIAEIEELLNLFM